MYRIFHKLFGWDYVFWRHIAGTYGISRIKQLPDKKYYIERHCIAGLTDLNNPYDLYALELTYLTCDASKYTGE